MSLKYEQQHSLLITKEFLREIISMKSREMKLSELKDRAHKCLRHFPRLDEKGKPCFSDDDFGEHYTK